MLTDAASSSAMKRKLLEPAETLPPHQLRELAVAAMVDPKTVARVIAGQATRPITRQRVVRALLDRGLQHLCRPSEARP